SFSLGANFIFLLQKQLRQNIKFFNVVTAGIITAILLTFGGNLHTLYTFFTPYHNDSPVAPIELAFSPQTFPNQYWYPNATRFIYHTIHEFPVYSFVVSDLHGHVLDIPAVLLMISVLLLFFLTPFTKSLKFFLRIILLGSLASIMYMTNAWDGLIYVGVATFVIFIKITFQTKKIQFSKELLLGLCTLFVSFIVISLPFSFFFKPFASQIGINCAPQALLNLGHFGPIVFEPGYCQTSPLWQLAILYGFFFFWFVSLAAFITRAYRKTKQTTSIDLFVLGMGILGFFLIIIPEFVYLKDIYTTYFRANTMFKLVYQSFILLSLVSGYSIYRIFSIFARDKKNIIKRLAVFCYTTMSIIMLSLVLIYPYFAVMSYFNQLKNFQGLNGTVYLKKISPDDYRAVLWINQHIQGQPTMLEAQGDSYTDYERISSNTGLPTVFGWMVHEWLWRGTYDIVPQRIADVKALYESPSIDETKTLLHKYNIAYVYIGDMERSKYEKIDEKKFIQLGTVVYSSENVKIYKVY
ncbi:MAG TPA: DUF2298 domain-containing protein, partial [Patescibacteria group bacterium]|nr:DUF2298 domain-containing protein [Patescibacteria group bacterium]